VRIAMVAGEHSGDRLAAGLIKALRAKIPALEVSGIGGPLMEEAGARLWYPMDDISVMGFDGLAEKLGQILRIRRQMIDRLLATRPDMYIGIDVPDFNIGLEYRLRQHAIPTVHYVSPTVWAWRSYRIRRIARSIDHMLTLFPFEADFYRRHNVPVTFVGHPMADDIEPDADPIPAREALGLDPSQRVVAVLPGSRTSEVRRLGPVFISAAGLLQRRYPGLQFVAPMVDHNSRMLFEQQLGQAQVNLALHIVDDQSRRAMAASDVVMLASGTAALEAALLGRPMVVAYRMSWWSYWLVRAFSHVNMYSMPNHLAGYRLVPELIQGEARAELVAREVARYLDEPDAAAAARSAFARMHETLRCGASERAAAVVAEMLGQC